MNRYFLVLSREWMGMREWDYNWYIYYGSFPHSLRSAPVRLLSIQLLGYPHDELEQPMTLVETSASAGAFFSEVKGPQIFNTVSKYYMIIWVAYFVLLGFAEQVGGYEWIWIMENPSTETDGRGRGVEGFSSILGRQAFQASGHFCGPWPLSPFWMGYPKPNFSGERWSFRWHGLPWLLTSDFFVSH